MKAQQVGPKDPDHPYFTELRNINANIARYEWFLAKWECYSCPCCCFVPVFGPMFDGMSEDFMQSIYNRVFSDMSSLDSRQALDVNQKDRWLTIERHRMRDPHWGKVKDDGFPHLNQVKAIVRDVSGDYDDTLEELEALILDYHNRVSFWQCYGAACFLFLPIIGCWWDGMKEDQMLRVFNKVYFALEGIEKRGLMRPAEVALWRSVHRMRDPHWERVKTEGQPAMYTMENIVRGLRAYWPIVTRESRSPSGGGAGAGAGDSDNHHHDYNNNNTITGRTKGVDASGDVGPTAPAAVMAHGNADYNSAFTSTTAPPPMASAVVIVDSTTNYAAGDIISNGSNYDNNNNSATLTQKLSDLNVARNQGLLTEMEFEKAKARLMEEFTSS
mmetsp:Transcript_27350/g.45863  ORF Transcript_27350/g.45863 Transcript_27350/m.45863 type:complete len:386 (+) Transcript_27350:35-1192(+)